MYDYTISQIYPNDTSTLKKVDSLLEQEGIIRDANLDYICGMYDDDYNIIATGSCFGNTLRCFAVDHTHQGEGLLNRIITHLIEVQYSRGNTHLFLYTKIDSSKFFGDLGFHEIARVSDRLVFMENRRTGFSSYLKKLQKETQKQLEEHNLTEESSKEHLTCGALVMNANPFTLGHQYLVEKAASECDLLHLFIVSEDASLVPFSVRKQLVKDGTAHLPNIIYHDSGPYIISNATFPSYFLKDEATVIESHAQLDIKIFTKICEALHVTRRYVGEEPTSQVTGIYNEIMKKQLPAVGVQCIVVPRKEENGAPISASTVRVLIQKNDFDALCHLVPTSTLNYFKSEEALPVIERIRKTSNVVHY